MSLFPLSTVPGIANSMVTDYRYSSCLPHMCQPDGLCSAFSVAFSSSEQEGGVSVTTGELRRLTNLCGDDTTARPTRWSMLIIMGCLRSRDGGMVGEHGGEDVEVSGLLSNKEAYGVSSRLNHVSGFTDGLAATETGLGLKKKIHQNTPKIYCCSRILEISKLFYDRKLILTSSLNVPQNSPCIPTSDLPTL